MKVAVFNTKSYERSALEKAANESYIEYLFLEPRLNEQTAVMASGCEAALIFVNDVANRTALEKLSAGGTVFWQPAAQGLIRSTGRRLVISGFNSPYVPAYSPNAVAEFTIGLILTLGRHIHKGHNRVRRADFNLEGLCGFELRDMTVGVCGTGKIGTAVVRLLSGFGCKTLVYDDCPNEEVILLASYVDTREELFRFSDILTLHVPLMPSTYHLIDDASLALMKDGVFLINTSRGALLDTAAVVEALKKGRLDSWPLMFMRRRPPFSLKTAPPTSSMMTSSPGF